MKHKSPQSLDKTLSWNTKYFVLLAFVFVGVSFFFNDLEYGIAIGAFVALITVLLVDYFQLLAHNHPKAWRAVKFIVIVVIILLTLISGFT